MPLHAPVDPYDGTPIRDRILLMSSTNVGKSLSLWHLAAALKESGSTASVFVIDTDCAHARIRVSPKWRQCDNVLVLPMRALSLDDRRHNWEILREHSQFVAKQAGPGDIIGIDMANRLWREVQNYASCVLQGIPDTSAAAENALRKRANWTGSGREPSDIEGWDWRHCNAMYDAFVAPLMFASQAHVIVCAPSSEFDAQDKLERNQEKRRLYSLVGAKPDGVQKDLVFQVDSILHLTKTALGRYVSTMKDREREFLSNAEWKDIVQSYLIPCAGWEMD